VEFPSEITYGVPFEIFSALNLFDDFAYTFETLMWKRRTDPGTTKGSGATRSTLRFVSSAEIGIVDAASEELNKCFESVGKAPRVCGQSHLYVAVIYLRSFLLHVADFPKMRQKALTILKLAMIHIEQAVSLLGSQVSTITQQETQQSAPLTVTPPIGMYIKSCITWKFCHKLLHHYYHSNRPAAAAHTSNCTCILSALVALASLRLLASIVRSSQEAFRQSADFKSPQLHPSTIAASAIANEPHISVWTYVSKQVGILLLRLTRDNPSGPYRLLYQKFLRIGGTVVQGRTSLDEAISIVTFLETETPNIPTVISTNNKHTRV